MINDMECPTFDFPVRPVSKTVMSPDKTTRQEKIDEMDIYIWKNDYGLVHNRKAEFIEKEKRLFPIILDQCLPSLRSQLEGTKTFEETKEKNDIVELLKLIRG